jgi:hypothetical protein
MPTPKATGRHDARRPDAITGYLDPKGLSIRLQLARITLKAVAEQPKSHIRA